MTTLVVAALSARLLAECAAREGFDVIALDVFGDRDTRRAAPRWWRIGADHSLSIDLQRCLGALAQIAADAAGGRGAEYPVPRKGSGAKPQPAPGRGQDLLGWVPGAGFEALPELLEQGAALLPLLGTAPSAVRRVRDAPTFFAALAQHGFAFPEVRFDAVPDDGTWLCKDMRGMGGWHIRRAVRGAAPPRHHYHQREVDGVPMSAAFIANGREARLLGCHEMIVRRIGRRPHVFCGVVGPVALPSDLLDAMALACNALSAAFALRGLCSLDFMRVHDRPLLLELNPRPGAALALYGDGYLTQGLMQAHVHACLHGELPEAPSPARQVRGTHIVFARRTMQLDDTATRLLAAWPGAHDIPQAGARFGAGDPLCSLEIDADDAMIASTQLTQRCEALLDRLESMT